MEEKRIVCSTCEAVPLASPGGSCQEKPDGKRSVFRENGMADLPGRSLADSRIVTPEA